MESILEKKSRLPIVVRSCKKKHSCQFVKFVAKRIIPEIASPVRYDSGRDNTLYF